MTQMETYGWTPGAVENYLHWIGGLEEGSRGTAEPRQEMPVSLKVEGADEVMKTLSHILVAAHDKAFLRLRWNGEVILTDSKDNEVPWDSTRLLQSGTVEDNNPEDPPDTIRIGYHTAYAARQHEDLTLHHPKPGRKAKYLEDPAMRRAPLIAEDIASALRGELGL